MVNIHHIHTLKFKIGHERYMLQRFSLKISPIKNYLLFNQRWISKQYRAPGTVGGGGGVFVELAK